jgi:hypothetical protein
MADNRGEDLGNALAPLVEIVFSPLFPVMLITLCGVSFVLSGPLGLPQFVLFFGLAVGAVEYARSHTWAMLALIAFVIAALPLARTGFREHATHTSRVVGHWVAAALFFAATLWLAHAWPYSGSGFQQIVFGLLLFTLWAHVCETALGTVKLILLSRPQPGREVVEAQKAHGDARLAGEAEAVALLNSKK